MSIHQNGEKQTQFLRAILDTIPSPAFIVDGDVRVQDFNRAAEPFMGPEPAATLFSRGGEVFHCIHAQVFGCGQARACRDCAIRSSVTQAIDGVSTCRRPHTAMLRTAAGTLGIDLLVTAGLLPYTDAPRALLILEGLPVNPPPMASAPIPRR